MQALLLGLFFCLGGLLFQSLHAFDHAFDHLLLFLDALLERLLRFRRRSAESLLSPPQAETAIERPRAMDSFMTGFMIHLVASFTLAIRNDPARGGRTEI